MKLSGVRQGVKAAVWMLAGVLLASCGNSKPVSGSGAAAAGGVKTFKICPGPNAQTETLIAFFKASEGDTIEFCEGQFAFTTGLILSGKRGITLKGAGKDKTLLSFANSDSAEGLNVSHADGVVMQGFTVADTPGNAIRVFKSKFVTFRDTRALWSGYDTCDTNPTVDNSCSLHGAYGLYPVQCNHVLIEDSESLGASDAGIYVGQTSDVQVRRTRAEYNVAGFEFENTYRAVFEDNIATNNTGGFLVFDLPGLAQYGEKNIVRRNKSFHNNTGNFAPVGNIVGSTPRGTGMLVLATDQLEVYENEIYDNDSFGIAIVNYGLADASEGDLRYDFYPEGMHIHNNIFRNNGGNLQLPDLNRGECNPTGGVIGDPSNPELPAQPPTLPADIIGCIQAATNNASLLPLIIALKNNGHSAHIVWDGGVDAPTGCTNFPKDKDGVPLNQANPGESAAERGEARVDERGRPNYNISDPGPDCGGKKYNAWKFDAQGALKKPENALCIEDNNQFINTDPRTTLINPFLNAKFSTPDPTDPNNLQPADTNIANYACVLPARPAPVLRLPFVPNPNSADRVPSDEENARACSGGGGSGPRFELLARYNCPQLSQYGLFANPEDPRTGANTGVPYQLNTQLFTDYASKYRFIFLPPGEKITYADHEHPDGLSAAKDSFGSGQEPPTATLIFPDGTVIAKTFAFKDGDTETSIETRLLIKRKTSTGAIQWVGLPYIWKAGTDGKRVAELKVEGGKTAVNYNYDDPDPEVNAHYQGATDLYSVPSALDCLTCHSGDDREAGTAPIGPKARNLNRDNVYAGTSMNQLAYLKQQGLMVGVPEDLSTIEKQPRWNVPGDAGDAPGSDADVHHRVRAYLEVNCAHCHNPAGAASNSGLALDSFRTVGRSYGICKRPIAAGRGSGEGRRYDIVPGDASVSILPFRLGSTEPGIRMPPVARSVVQGEASNLITTWINDVLPTADTEGEEACSGSALPLR
jgi:parallel beta-helix repeat protein